MTELRHCKGREAALSGLLLDPQSASAEVLTHLDGCQGCRRELEELRAAMGLMEAWTAPEPSPYFFTRLNARLREERQAAPLGWFARLRAGFVYGPRTHARPLVAMALTVALLLGGSAYLGLSNWMQPAPQSENEAVVHDLQTLDNNAQVLDTLEQLSSTNDDGD
jgi:hypothetical protein